MIWLQFAVCTAIILFTGTKLSFYGDVIAEKTGLGRMWIGVILLASVTSLPELVTGVSSVALHDLPNIAAGDVLGSCMFNLIILALLDTRRKGLPLATLARQGHVLTAASGILLLILVTICIVAGDRFPSFGWVGWYSVLFVLIYMLSMWSIFRRESAHSATHSGGEAPLYASLSKQGAYLRFCACAAVIIATATYLPHVGDEIARITGWGRSFVGSMFIALATSLPEVVVSRGALKLGAVDLAFGNILGSNLFNIAILAIDDFFFRRGPLLSHVSASHAMTAATAAIMTGIITLALVSRARHRFLLFSLDSVGVLLLYVTAVFLLYFLQ